MTTTVEGRERYAVCLRYAREFRDNPEDVKDVLVPTPTGVQVPLGELADVAYVQGPQNIKMRILTCSPTSSLIKSLNLQR